MFCLKVLRNHRFSKLLSNSTQFHSIDGKHISNSYNIHRNVEQIFKTSADNSVDNKTKSKNRFIDDLVYRRDTLQHFFVLSQSVIKGNKKLNELIDEKEFNDLCHTVDDNVRLLSNKELSNCLHSLLSLDLDPNTKIIQVLENEVLWRSKGMALKDILNCLSFHVRYQSTDQQKKVVNELIINLILKLDNAANDNEIIHLLSLWRSLSPEIIERIEMTALEMIGRNDENSFKINSLSYILVLLSQMNRRTKPLIKAVVNKFTYSSIDLKDCKESHLIKMISSLNKLNYCDINFLRKASDFLCNKKFLNNVAPSDRRDLLVAISQFNWSYPRLLDQYVEKITDTNNDFSSQDFLVLISSFARLYCRSDYLNDILNTYVTPFIKSEDFDCESWLLYVWSLSIIGCVPLKSINSVLNKEFFDRLISQTEQTSNESPNFKQIVAKLKILNIRGVAEIEMNEKIDFKLFSDTNYELTKKEASVEKFKKSIQQELSQFVSNISTNVLTPFGFTIDAEFIVNKDLASLPLSEFGSLNLSLGNYSSNELPTLPEGYKRCAVLCLGFNDTLLDGSDFIGIHELSIRLLKRFGYSVIPITETTFPSYLKSSQKSDKFKSLLNQLFK